MLKRLVLIAAIILPSVTSAEPIVPHGTIGQRSQSALGLVAFTVIAFIIGQLRGAKKIPWRVIAWGTILEFVFGALVIVSPAVLQPVQAAIQRLLDFSNEGAPMVFGNLITPIVNVTRDANGGAVTGYAQI